MATRSSDKNLKPEINSALFTNSCKGSFSFKNTIDCPPQCRTFIKLSGKPAYANPLESRTCKIIHYRSVWGEGAIRYIDPVCVSIRPSFLFIDVSAKGQ